MARIVLGQERGHVHVEGEDVANGVLVLDAAQAPEGFGPARVGMRRGRLVEGAFQMVRERIVRRLVRAGHSRRRHHSSPELADHLLPRPGVGLDSRNVESIEREAAGAGPVVMTRQAIAIERRLLGRRCPGRGRGGLPSRLSGPECHGGKKTTRKLNVLDLDAMLQDPRKMIIPGDPDGSLLIQRIEDHDAPMPPEDTLPPVSPTDGQLLRDWIAGMR